MAHETSSDVSTAPQFCRRASLGIALLIFCLLVAPKSLMMNSKVVLVGPHMDVIYDKEVLQHLARVRATVREEM